MISLEHELSCCEYGCHLRGSPERRHGWCQLAYGDILLSFSEAYRH